MIKDIEMLKAGEIPMIQNGDVISFNVTCDCCGEMFVEESHNDPSKDAHGVHGISLCSDCQ